MSRYDMITVLGPTASGKTPFATTLAGEIDSEIISADSRQVYKNMTIGTGKDLKDYTCNGKVIPYHLIDIREAGEKYTLFDYQTDFHQAYNKIKEKGKIPILCGGTGMYIEAVLKGYQLPDVPPNPELRKRLDNFSLEELTQLLSTYKNLHNKTDVDSKKRAIRAIEIADFTQKHHADIQSYQPINSLIIGLNISREKRREKITKRLHSRLKEGMVDEVQGILDSGVKPEDLIYYGLEYKFVTQYLIGELQYDEMVSLLEIAIHQFAKRQMTWFRGMERRGLNIHWLDIERPREELINEVIKLLKA